MDNTNKLAELLSNMDRGVLRMPFDLAMADPLTQKQFYERTQSLLNRIDATPTADQATQGAEPGVPFGWFMQHADNGQWGAYQVSAAYASDPKAFQLYSHPAPASASEPASKEEWLARATETLDALDKKADERRQRLGLGSVAGAGEAWQLQFLTDVVTAAGLLSGGKRDKGLAERIGRDAMRFRFVLAARPVVQGDREARKQALEDAIKACENEYLCEPNPNFEDRAYDQGVRDCVNALRAIVTNEREASHG